MKKILLLLASVMFMASGCIPDSEATKEAQKVSSQQGQYVKAQPVPSFDWSLERHLLDQLYKLRNMKVATHVVWRSDYGMIEGDCPAMGYGIPYDSSMTNPLMTTDENQRGGNEASLAVVEQAEPNGIFASKNTTATWVMCTNELGGLSPVYVESKVTGYPGSVIVNYETNRVTMSGASTVNIPKK